jgi:hypothetical protein
MRTIYGLLAISLLMFIAGGVLFFLGARNLSRTPASAAPVASVKQLMRGIVGPSSRAVYDAVSTTVTENGTQEVFPRNDGEWETVASHAMALVEAASLLKVEGRAKDSGAWMRLSDSMAKAAMQSYRAAEQQSTEGLLASGEVLNDSCDNCHREYDVPIE